MLGEYHANHLHDYATAIRLLRHSVETRPTAVQYRLNLARMYMVAGRIADARSELDLATDLDVLGEYKGKITQEHRNLELYTRRSGSSR